MWKDYTLQRLPLDLVAGSCSRARFAKLATRTWFLGEPCSASGIKWTRPCLDTLSSNMFQMSGTPIAAGLPTSRASSLPLAHTWGLGSAPQFDPFVWPCKLSLYVRQNGGTAILSKDAPAHCQAQVAIAGTCWPTRQATCSWSLKTQCQDMLLYSCKNASVQHAK